MSLTHLQLCPVEQLCRNAYNGHTREPVAGLEEFLIDWKICQSFDLPRYVFQLFRRQLRFPRICLSDNRSAAPCIDFYRLSDIEDDPGCQTVM